MNRDGKLILSWIIVVIFCLQTFHANTQKINPFDVKQRLNQVKQDSISTIITSTSADTTYQNSSVNTFTTDTVALPSQTKQEVNPFDVNHVPLRKSQFEKRKEKLDTEIKATHKSNGFLIWFLLFSCALLAILINTRSKTLAFIPQTLYNENILKLIHREESGKYSSFFVIMYVIYIINISIAVYLITSYYTDFKGIDNLAIILGSMTLVYVAKHFLLNVFGYIFDISKSTSLYNFTIIVFNSVIGLFLLPVNFITAFVPDDYKHIGIIASIIVVCLLLFLRYLRGFFIAAEYIFGRMLQFFIYLCTFEVAPIVIGIKILLKIMA